MIRVPCGANSSEGMRRRERPLWGSQFDTLEVRFWRAFIRKGQQWLFTVNSVPTYSLEESPRRGIFMGDPLPRRETAATRPCDACSTPRLLDGAPPARSARPAAGRRGPRGL